MFRSLFLGTAAGLALSAISPLPAAAQYPRSERGRFEVRGLDFRPDGAWRARASAVRTRRHQLLRAGAVGALNLSSHAIGGGSAVTGRFHVPVVPIAFLNVPAPHAIDRYQDALFHGVASRPYSLKTFYEQMANGRIQMDGRVFPWVSAPQADIYYEDGCNGVGVTNACPNGGRRFGELILHALNQVSGGATAATVWHEFDNDGLDGQPNSGDDDGFVDFVTFLQPEQDGACGTTNIWAHRYVVSAFNGNSPFVTQTPWTGHPGQFLKIDDYTIQSAVGGESSCEPATIMSIGTMAHETGHAFGLPDLYDTDPSGSATEGIGEWGLMGSGNYARPYSPARMEGWSLLELGWVAADTLRSSRTVRLSPVTSSDTVLVAPIEGTDEYLLIENRQALESDTAMMNPQWTSRYPDGTARRKGPGLLVWHIDQGQVDEHGFGGDNAVNRGPVHGVALLQADGRGELDQPGTPNRGDAGDAYPGTASVRRLASTTTPSTLDNQGTFTGIAIDSIQEVTPGRPGAIAFRFLRRAATVVRSNRPDARVTVNGLIHTGGYRDVHAQGDALSVSVEELQTTSDSRSRYRFLRWSNGGGRAQTVLAGAGPDTLVAELGAEHRLSWVLGGNGAINATGTPPGYANTGFVPEGTSVTLTAEAPAGSSFVRWTGDTTSTDPTLVLPMARPYVVTANFSGIAAVAMTDAVDAILGKRALPAAQSASLDQLGNRNGTYDVGDFLAYVQRVGQQPSPEMMTRIMGEAARPAPARKERRK